MSESPITRRTFLGAAGAAVAGAGLARPASALATAVPDARGAAPMVLVRRFLASPVAAGSANGLRGVARAVELMDKGTDTLDAGVEGVKIQELDPSDHSVGYGGLPNEDGVVQCDASCMHGPTKRAGAVGALEGIKTASEIARLVMKYTDHIMLVGKDAQRFAVSYGYEVVDMLTPEARQMWLAWRANRGASDDWVNVSHDEQMVHRPTGTINMDLVGANGDISSITTTAGLAFKIPGRVGDSAIIGAGQYADNDVGASGSTGLGELNMMVCGGFQVVDSMRKGMAPTDACLATLRRVLAMTPPRWLKPNGEPNYDLQYYAVNKKGEYGAASFRPAPFAVCDAKGARHEDCAVIYP